MSGPILCAVGTTAGTIRVDCERSRLRARIIKLRDGIRKHLSKYDMDRTDVLDLEALLTNDGAE